MSLAKVLPVDGGQYAGKKLAPDRCGETTGCPFGPAGRTSGNFRQMITTVGVLAGADI